MLNELGPPGAFFRSLDKSGQRTFAQNLTLRRRRYTNITAYLRGAARLGEEVRDKILLIGDRPGPSAPVDPGYHHTPFYSTKHCSGWLNNLQVKTETPEDQLVWINSTDFRGLPLPASIINDLDPHSIVILGGHARKWFETTDGWEEYCPFVEDVPHPQYWKRFKNKEPYPLFQVLTGFVDFALGEK
jgi:hypothetical protein